MKSYVLGLRDIDQTALSAVGGKGANLGEVARIEGIRVPDGFCITTEAFKRLAPAIGDRLDALSRLTVEDGEQLRALSAEIRRVIEGTPIPDDLRAEILARLDDDTAYAVRSSATAEDLPTASFAGQQDTYLNVKGKEAVLTHISRCWASLFTERAVVYRLQNGFDHRQVQLAVVVQAMVFPQVSGILFTADPVTGHRQVSSIDAAFGLGDALVSGRVNGDVYKVRDGHILETKTATAQPALTAAQIGRLEQLGRTIEAHFGRPQDIEWCLADDTFHIVQSRPITTLFPVPEAQDPTLHVYVSVGHQQMMTDPLKPLGLSVWQLTAPRPMPTAGGRLFVDVTPELSSPAGRHVLINVLGKSDPLIQDALKTVLERGDFTPSAPDAPQGPPPGRFQALDDYDATVVAELIARQQESLAELKRTIQDQSGPGLFDFIREDIRKANQARAESQSLGVIVTAMNAANWLNDNLGAWLGEKNPANTLSQSVPHNVTSEMGLALLDVADVIRPYPAVIDYLQHARDDGFLDGLSVLDGGEEAQDALRAFLDRYGMRCAGEIDITRDRWAEKPTTLVPIILSNIKNFEPGASRRKFEQGRDEALRKEADLLARLKALPEGDEKARETKRMIDLVRNLSGYREYPKYGIVSRYFVYKQALLREADRLVQAGVLEDREDVYFLRFEEFEDLVRTHQADPDLIRRRQDDFKRYERLTPPRVMTSDGEIITGRYQRDHLPAGALVGLPVSSGVIEGRARVLVRLEDADLEDGDILVTRFTDPSWTPLFVAVKGLVTEVGGLMTHGAVIAREYGLPAVIGVEDATRRIRDGQRIRVHGTDGYVEILG